MKKTISISIPCYNEEDNVIPLTEELKRMFEKDLADYNYEIVFIDNCSTDKTRQHLEELCLKDKYVKAIFNERNFLWQSGYYGLLQTTGDCTINIPADFQIPINIIPCLVAEWEKGYKIVCAIKTSSKEGEILWFGRSLYYKVLKIISNNNVMEHFTGNALYDKKFLDVLRNLDDPTPSLFMQVSKLGFKITNVEFEQNQRNSGKSKHNIASLIDTTIKRTLNLTDNGPHIALLSGIIVLMISSSSGIIYSVLKFISWNHVNGWIIPLILVISFFNGLQLFFIGLIGEYVIKNNQRLMNYPLVIEEKRINFSNDKGEEYENENW